MTGGVPYLDGHCQSHGKPDQYHGLCPGEYRTPFGVLKTCSCPNHESAQTPTVDRDSSPADGTIGAEVKTAPGGALTPESQGLADYEGVD